MNDNDCSQPIKQAMYPLYVMTGEDLKVWDVYFTGIVSMTMHPGFLREDTEQPTLKQCAEMATEMMSIRRKELWPDGQH